MKYLNKIILFTLILVLFGGCDSPFLDSAPQSFTSPKNFYKTADDAELALAGAYAVLNEGRIQNDRDNGTWSKSLIFMLNGGTDELLPFQSKPGYTPWGLDSYTSGNELARSSWHFFYAGINRANMLLEHLDQIDMNEERKKEIEAESRFLRGFYHMYLAKMFGGVPTYTSSVQDPEKARQPIKEVYDLVIKDFKFAYQNLPDRASIKGRANKWTAAGYLLQLYCYLGSSKMNKVGEGLDFSLNSFAWVDANKMYQNAKGISTDIINNSGYTLIDNYDYLFRERTTKYKYEESLFGVESSSDAASGQYMNLSNTLTPKGNRNKFGGGNGWFRPAYELYDLYNSDDFRRDYNLAGKIKGKNGTVSIDGFNYYIPDAPNPNKGTYSVGKFRYIDPAQKSIPSWAFGGYYPLLRYANVILLRAEALYFTGDESGARAELTKIRSRALKAGADVSTLNAAYQKTDFVQELLDERSRELCFETLRRFDLERFGKFGESLDRLDPNANNFNQVVTEMKKNWKPFRIWFPIPQTEIDLNSNLKQNPGY